MAEDKKEKQEKDMIAEYNKLRSKHTLPDYNELDREFLLGTLEPGNFVLRSVCAKIEERLGFALKILGNLIQPENHLSDMQEAEHLSAADKKKVNDLFKRMAYYEKEFLLRDFDYDEEATAELIKTFCREWLKMKPDLLQVLAAIRDTWRQKEPSEREYGGYFG